MSIILSLQSGSTIYIENIAFAGGGEGDVYRVTQPAAPQKQVVKLYKPNKRNTERAQKIAYLIANPPFPSTAGFLQQNKISIVWATDMVYENKQFAGFVMPAAEGVKLEMLCQTKLPPTLGKEWQRGWPRPARPHAGCVGGSGATAGARVTTNADLGRRCLWPALTRCNTLACHDGRPA